MADLTIIQRLEAIIKAIEDYAPRDHDSQILQPYWRWRYNMLQDLKKLQAWKKAAANQQPPPPPS